MAGGRVIGVDGFILADTEGPDVAVWASHVGERLGAMAPMDRWRAYGVAPVAGAVSVGG